MYDATLIIQADGPEPMTLNNVTIPTDGGVYHLNSYAREVNPDRRETLGGTQPGSTGGQRGALSTTPRYRAKYRWRS